MPQDAFRLLRYEGEQAACGFAQQADVASQFLVLRLTKRRIVGSGEAEGRLDLTPDADAGGDAERLLGSAIFQWQAVDDEQRIHRVAMPGDYSGAIGFCAIGTIHTAWGCRTTWSTSRGRPRDRW